MVGGRKVEKYVLALVKCHPATRFVGKSYIQDETEDVLLAVQLFGGKIIIIGHFKINDSYGSPN